ncbi:uncharacterized protein PGTG_06825 [Puccinia graminis f. sp. tritici CRL 75-36-700-3]|uniref:Uncharacterized protein n=1 Tax=Puccinia graminis f. sp. tritici (strain CRL 75-36-700-3 / race SCCL) TaxID=418459 RepID=E3KAV5_PUCGT|nr:uncharacterized protein PGTG_06825 [Puccinia graminis f. sp. tritici CRL 75-36-700-3]EFP81204.1 hypothetical protein PGTG_06825 [Puccinia graminis f. sp. tritici CRL 75-36-700-3]
MNIRGCELITRNIIANGNDSFTYEVPRVERPGGRRVHGPATTPPYWLTFRFPDAEVINRHRNLHISYVGTVTLDVGTGVLRVTSAITNIGRFPPRSFIANLRIGPLVSAMGVVVEVEELTVNVMGRRVDYTEKFHPRVPW